MATSSAGGGATEGPIPDAAFAKFMNEVKGIEKRDAVLTSAQQIERLLKPGSKYRNLNPYEVLMVDPDIPEDKLRSAYRKLSFLVHPDKNLDDRDRAQLAFEAVSNAYKILQDEEQLEYCKGVAEEAKVVTDEKIAEKKKLAKKQGKDYIEEDDPEVYKQLYMNNMTKLFTDLDIKKKQIAEREQMERKRQREEQEEIEIKAKKEKEMKKEWEEARNERVDSWRNFQTKGSKKKKKNKTSTGGLKPPKLKQEKRL